MNHRIGAFAHLRFSADTQDQVVQAFMGRIDQYLAGIQNCLLFFELWWKSLDEPAANRLLDIAGDYRYWLEEIRHEKPYTLSEAEEKVINIKDVTGSRALKDLYASLTNRYLFKVNIDGEEKELTRGELMTCVRDADPDLRACAYQELYRVFGQDGSILSQLYQALVRDWRSEKIGLRGFANPMAARNLYNDIPDDVVDTLLEVCRRNTGVFQRYFRLKARWLGVEKLRRYDIYAPLVKSDIRYSFDQAAHTVMESFDAFLPVTARLARRVFDEQHLDSEVRKGKRSGAFLRHHHPRSNTLRAGQLPGPGRGCCHPGSRAGARHALHAGRAPQPLYPAPQPTPGRDGIYFRGDAAGRPVAGRGKRRCGAARPALPPDG